MDFTTAQLEYMANVFIDPEGFPPEDYEMVVGIKAVIDDKLS